MNKKAHLDGKRDSLQGFPLTKLRDTKLTDYKK